MKQSIFVLNRMTMACALLPLIFSGAALAANNESGAITSVMGYFVNKTASVDGNFKNNVDHVQLQVNNKVLGSAKTVRPISGFNMGTFSIPVQKGAISTRDDKVTVIAYNDKNSIVDQKSVMVIPDASNGRLTLMPYSLTSSHSIDGRYEGDVKMLELEINGKNQGRVMVGSTANFSLPVAKGAITDRADKVNIVSYNSKNAKISSTKVIVFP